VYSVLKAHLPSGAKEINGVEERGESERSVESVNEKSMTQIR